MHHIIRCYMKNNEEYVGHVERMKEGKISTISTKKWYKYIKMGSFLRLMKVRVL